MADKPYSEMSEARKEKIRANCRAYYYRNHKAQKKRVNAIYHSMVSTKEGREHMRELQRKAGAKRRYGEFSREQLIEEAKGECENTFCKGVSKTLHIHHIDNEGRAANAENRPSNNSRENLMVLCSSCHVGHHVWFWKIQKKV